MDSLALDAMFPVAAAEEFEAAMEYEKESK
jgi:hypothetical protein